MTTELKLFKDAYATMTVAAYEPIIVRWLSKAALWEIVQMYVSRVIPKEQSALLKNPDRIVAKPFETRAELRRPALDELLTKSKVDPRKLGRGDGPLRLRDLPAEARDQLYSHYPQLDEIGDTLVPNGAMTVDSLEKLAALPIMFNSDSLGSRVDLDIVDVRGKMLKKVAAYLDGLSKLKPEDLPETAELRNKMLENMHEILGDDFLPGMDFLWAYGDWEETLSPVGLAHFYRQLYFNLDEGVGPIEEAFTVAPSERLEVLYQTVRRQTHEEQMEFGSETNTESSVESRNLDEVSDKVSSMIQRDSSAAMSASANVSASGGIGVWNVSAGATFGANSALSSSNQRSTESASRRLKETTTRAAERITKTYTIKTRDVLELETTNTTRRIIENTTGAPVNYGLRRVMRRVRVKVQSLGPRLVWQLYVRDPGKGLARSKFVHFLDSDEISIPANPPAMPPRPAGGVDTGVTSAALQFNGTYFVTLSIRAGSDRKITAVSIDSLTDLEGGGKDDIAPSAMNNVQWGQTYDSATGTFTVNIGVVRGDSASLQVNYSYVYEPGPTVLQSWENQKAAVMAAWEAEQAEARAEALLEKFERERELITERSKIPSRPANDLRREERFEVMNRMISHLFARSTRSAAPEPIEIELFHRYFDVDALFLYTHPAWWKPRYAPVKTGLRRRPYEVTAESDPARMGSSLGWMMQLDGDTRRNEFLNSPWIRVCLPMRPGREREAVAWLAEHVEGTIGYDPDANPLKKLLGDIDDTRKREASLGIDGPEYVTVSSTVGAPGEALTPENVFPVVDEFDVTVPTDGFVYDEINVTVP